MKRLLLLALVLIAPNFQAAPAGDIKESWQSPSGAIIAAAFYRGDDSPKQIYLRNAAGEPQWVYLCEFERGAKVLFSPDERWLAINDYALSNIAVIRLFKRESGLQFTETNLKPSEVAWALLGRVCRVPYPRQLDHEYSEVLCWASDSSSLLVRIWGHGDTNHNVDDWLCVYSLNSHRASVDLSILNHGAVTYKRGHNAAP